MKKPISRRNVLKDAGVLLIVSILVLTAIFVFTPMTMVTKATPTVVLLSEDFEGSWGPYGDNPPAGWEIHDFGTESPPVWNNNDWHKSTYSGQGSTARVYYSPIENQDEWLVTPKINCDGLDTITLKFWSYFYYYSSASHAYVEGSINDGQTFPYQIDSYTLTHMGPMTYDISGWAKNKPDVKIRFRYVDSNGMYWRIDDVEVSGDQLVVGPDLIIQDRSTGTLIEISDNIYEPPSWSSVTQIGKWTSQRLPGPFYTRYNCWIELQNDGAVGLVGYTINTTLISDSPGTRGYLFYRSITHPNIWTRMKIGQSTTTGLDILPGDSRFLRLYVRTPNAEVSTLEVGIHVNSISGAEDSVIFRPGP